MSSNLFSQLDIGKRSLMAQQAGMNVAGHNIANIDNEDYSRQQVVLEDQHPRKSRFGAGVDIDGVERLTDRFTNRRLVGEQSRLGSLESREDALVRLEQIFNEVQGAGLRKALNEFWDAWGHLANKPESEIHRSELIAQAEGLTRKFREVSGNLQDLRTELNNRVSRRVEEANQLAGKIARLNKTIQQTDRGKGEANDLRDERQAALKDLSKLLHVEWFEDEDNLMHVSVGNGWPLVDGRRANHLEASLRNEDEPGMFRLRGVDPQGISRDLTGEVSSGQIAELLRLRDETVVAYADKVDSLASELAFKVNRLHVQGTGINASHQRLRSSFALKPDALGRPLPFLKEGVLTLHLVNRNNEKLETYEIGIRPGQDSVRDIVQRINETVGDPELFQARVNDDGSVTLAAGGTRRFVIGEDSSDFAVLMGFNNFFETLHGAEDIAVNDRLEAEPNRISAGKGLIPGDNSVALAIHDLQFQPTMEDESITFDEFYNGLMADLGLTVQRSQTEKKNQQTVVDQFQKLRNEVSSVSMDEEVADMVQYQRGFDAAAKFLTTVDEMTRTVIEM